MKLLFLMLFLVSLGSCTKDVTDVNGRSHKIGVNFNIPNGWKIEDVMGEYLIALDMENCKWLFKYNKTSGYTVITFSKIGCDKEK